MYIFHYLQLCTKAIIPIKYSDKCILSEVGFQASIKVSKLTSSPDWDISLSETPSINSFMTKQNPSKSPMISLPDKKPSLEVLLVVLLHILPLHTQLWRLDKFSIPKSENNGEETMVASLKDLMPSKNKTPLTRDPSPTSSDISPLMPLWPAPTITSMKAGSSDSASLISSSLLLYS